MSNGAALHEPADLSRSASLPVLGPQWKPGHREGVGVLILGLGQRELDTWVTTGRMAYVGLTQSSADKTWFYVRVHTHAHEMKIFKGRSTPADKGKTEM